jgi:hypothetical protein
MGDHNRRYAAEHFRSDAVVEDLERIFSRVLDPSGARAVGHGDAKIIHG